MKGGIFMGNNYVNKLLKMPLEKYMKEYNIELKKNERQIIINGVKTNYVANKKGEIFSYQTNCNRPTKLKPIILGKVDNNRKLKSYDPDLLYRGVNLVVNGKEKMYYIHRIIAITFIPNPYGKTEVNHIDGNKVNNTVKNLEWVTPSENQMHAFLKGLQKSRKGSNHHNIKIDEDIAYEICNYILYTSLTLRQIAKELHTTHTIVSKINKGQRWKHVSKCFNLNYPLYSNRKNLIPIKLND